MTLMVGSIFDRLGAQEQLTTNITNLLYNKSTLKSRPGSSTSKIVMDCSLLLLHLLCREADVLKASCSVHTRRILHQSIPDLDPCPSLPTYARVCRILLILVISSESA